MRASLQDDSSQYEEGLDDLPGVPPGMGEPINDPLTVNHDESGEASADGSGSDGKTRTRSDTFRPKLNAAVAKGYTEAAAATVNAVGGVLNSAVALDEEDDIWLPTDEETDQIAEPLGRIAARHIPTPGGDMDPGDVADAIAIGVGLVVYAIRNLNQAFRRRRDRRRLLQAQVLAESAAS